MDWQTKFSTIKDRVRHLLQSKKLADCRFLVGPSSNQCLIEGHRLILATASPVFESMLYGSLKEENDPIILPDIHPVAFKAVLVFIYTNDISISSFANACNLYEAAKKYMLPRVVEHCTYFLLTYINPNTACRTYELGKLYEEKRIMENSMKHIVMNTWQVIAEPSSFDIKATTLIDIFDQDRLNIYSELDLFHCLFKVASKQGVLNNGDRYEVSHDNAQRIKITQALLRQAFKKIRFLTMTPKQFAEGPAHCNLLMQKEALAILIKLVSPTSNVYPMPEGFSQSGERDRDVNDHIKCYSLTTSIKSVDRPYHCTQKLQPTLIFEVNTNIYLLGIHINLIGPFEKDIECITTSIRNFQHPEIVCTSSIKNKIDSTYELTFKKPVFIYRDENYSITIKDIPVQHFLKYSWNRTMLCQDVKFNIITDSSSDGINFSSHISGFVFTT